jgi:hypothetical protein
MKNIMNGIGYTRFGPNEALTRAMVVTILYRMDGKEAVSPYLKCRLFLIVASARMIQLSLCGIRQPRQIIGRLGAE